MRGHVGSITRGAIGGWAANPDKPEEEVGVIVRVNGQQAKLRANEAREELKKLFAGSTGRYGFKFQPPNWPLSPFETHEIEVMFARTGELIPGGHVVLPAVSPFPTAPIPSFHGLVPIVLTTTGRSGSSLLMGRLATHPDIVVGRDHPYEVKLLTYYTLLMRTMLADADRQNSADPNTMAAQANRFAIGFNPFNDALLRRDAPMVEYWASVAPPILRASMRALIDNFYATSARSGRKTLRRYYAEKIGTSELTLQGTSFLYDEVREIVLIRDPRDVVCSSRAFWKRELEASIASLTAQIAFMLEPRPAGNIRQHFVKYEDLLLRPEETQQAMYTFLGLEPQAVVDPARQAEIEVEVLARHGTSSAGQSIGRWRRDLSFDEISACEAAFSPLYKQLGYEPA